MPEHPGAASAVAWADSDDTEGTDMDSTGNRHPAGGGLPDDRETGPVVGLDGGEAGQGRPARAVGKDAAGKAESGPAEEVLLLLPAAAEIAEGWASTPS